MDILTIIAGRDFAYEVIDALCGKTADKNPYAYDKLCNVRRYLKTSTIAEANGYHKEESTNVKL